jgi:hypothetical protein
MFAWEWSAAQTNVFSFVSDQKVATSNRFLGL